MDVGNRVLSILKEKGLKQNELAAYLGTRPSTISGWADKNRNPSSDLIVRICEFLNVDCRYLLTGVQPKDTSISASDEEWLSLIHRLPINAQIEFKAEIRGYLKAREPQRKVSGN